MVEGEERWGERLCETFNARLKLGEWLSEMFGERSVGRCGMGLHESGCLGSWVRGCVRV